MGSGEIVLDRQQWLAITHGDEAYGRELMQLLLEDTRRQKSSIEQAIARRDATELRRLAHYSKGACDGVGARASACLLRAMEQEAAQGDFHACRILLRGLGAELDKLEREVPPKAPAGPPPSATPAPRPGKVAPRA
jgi:HPt (histidine-containing phosphotransfer) domain-containing protein